jgi:hypothetical protein
VGGPPQIDLFDYKPKMANGTTKMYPESRVRRPAFDGYDDDERPVRCFLIAPLKFKFAQAGKCGMWMSEL